MDMRDDGQRGGGVPTVSLVAAAPCIECVGDVSSSPTSIRLDDRGTCWLPEAMITAFQGRKLDAHVSADLLRRSRAREVRTVTRGEPLTPDVVTGRLTIVLDRNGVILEIDCF